jgi:hypothetical protein
MLVNFASDVKATIWEGIIAAEVKPERPIGTLGVGASPMELILQAGLDVDYNDEKAADHAVSLGKQR